MAIGGLNRFVRKMRNSPRNRFPSRVTITVPESPQKIGPPPPRHTVAAIVSTGVPVAFAALGLTGYRPGGTRLRVVSARPKSAAASWIVYPSDPAHEDVRAIAPEPFAVVCMAPSTRSVNSPVASVDPLKRCQAPVRETTAAPPPTRSAATRHPGMSDMLRLVGSRIRVASSRRLTSVIQRRIRSQFVAPPLLDP